MLRYYASLAQFLFVFAQWTFFAALKPFVDASRVEVMEALQLPQLVILLEVIHTDDAVYFVSIVFSAVLEFCFFKFEGW